ncbi:MAG: hypothetical protein ABIF40_00120 [archaeon]
MNKPIKSYKSGCLQGAIWFNERTVEGNVVGFKTVSLKRSWKDKEKDIWRDESMNLRRSDIPKVLVILNKIQEDLFLTGGEDNE